MVLNQPLKKAWRIRKNVAFKLKLKNWNSKTTHTDNWTTEKKTVNKRTPNRIATNEFSHNFLSVRSSSQRICFFLHSSTHLHRSTLCVGIFYFCCFNFISFRFHLTTRLYPMKTMIHCNSADENGNAFNAGWEEGSGGWWIVNRKTKRIRWKKLNTQMRLILIRREQEMKSAEKNGHTKNIWKWEITTSEVEKQKKH